MRAQQNMSNISFFMGMASLVLLFFGFAIPFAALGLILSLLSRGAGKMLPRAKTGFVMSVIGLAIGLAITISSVYLIRSGILRETYEQMQEMLDNSGGDNETEELLEQLKVILDASDSPDGSVNGSSMNGGDSK